MSLLRVEPVVEKPWLLDKARYRSSANFFTGLQYCTRLIFFCVLYFCLTPINLIDIFDNTPESLVGLIRKFFHDVNFPETISHFELTEYVFFEREDTGLDEFCWVSVAYAVNFPIATINVFINSFSPWIKIVSIPFFMCSFMKLTSLSLCTLKKKFVEVYSNSDSFLKSVPFWKNPNSIKCIRIRIFSSRLSRLGKTEICSTSIVWFLVELQQCLTKRPFRPQVLQFLSLAGNVVLGLF